MKLNRMMVVLVFLPLAMLPTATAQVSGQLSGVVVDAQDASVPGATVTVTEVLSKQARVYETQANGSFRFPGLLAGNYNFRVEKAGFRSYERTGVAMETEVEFWGSDG